MAASAEASVSKSETEMQVFGRARLSDLCGDMVIYRNLQPLDSRLSSVKVALRELDLSTDHRPRKQDEAYARVALWYAKEAQVKRNVSQSLQELLFIGDTIFNDGRAYANMQSLSGWEGSCFIGVENLEEEAAICIDDEGIYGSNRWSNIGNWARWLIEEREMRLDAGTVVIIDIDKCVLGARGRNDAVIDQARIQGAYRTMNNLLGDDFDGGQFELFYNELNQPRYHCLTQDNQDYLAYICLVLSTGLISLEEITDEVDEGHMDNFSQFTRLVETRMMISSIRSETLRESHDAVTTSVRNGDPTPFKRFRRQEFIATVERMGQMPDDSGIEELLDNEITLTEEVWEVAEWLTERGCLLLCLSDKPDEASCPHRYVSPSLPPIHQAETHRVGVSIRAALDAIGHD